MKGGFFLYNMATLITSISLTAEEKAFLELYNLSASALIKEKIHELQGFLKTSSEEKIEKLAKTLAMKCEQYEVLRAAAIDNGIIQEEDENFK